MHAPPFSGFDWEMQIQTHYTRKVYDIFLNEHLKRLYHCEIEKHPNFDAVEGVEKYIITDYSIKRDFHGNHFAYTVEYRLNNQYLDCNCKNFKSEGIVCCHILRTMSHKRINNFHDRYILRRWRRDVIRPHLSKFFPGDYPTMTDEYKKYNSLKKWFDRNCDLVLDNNVKYEDFKNILKDRFSAYTDWNDDMVVSSVGDPDSDDNVTFIRNLREVRSRGRPQMNRNRSARDNIFRRGGGRWNTSYYEATQEGETSQDRRGDGRRIGRRRAGRGGGNR